MGAVPQGFEHELMTEEWTLAYGLVGALSLLLKDLSRATSLVDVNIAAGKAREDLADLLTEGPQELGELIHLGL